jgi:hypothetical protein
MPVIAQRAAYMDDSRKAIDTLTIALGTWLLLSPFILRFSEFESTNEMLMGALMVVLGFWRMTLYEPAAPRAVIDTTRFNDSGGTPRYTLAAIALWLAISPFLLGYASQPVPVVNLFACSIGAILLSTGGSGCERCD